ncbi:hypothetical protein T09_12064 [Trichinella sp. T9]|nr:hypothetical protein T09_12064 [Trichinella sp. T9]
MVRINRTPDGVTSGSQSVGREQFLGGSLTVNLRITSTV